jgi:hypothetical protein
VPQRSFAGQLLVVTSSATALSHRLPQMPRFHPKPKVGDKEFFHFSLQPINKLAIKPLVTNDL